MLVGKVYSGAVWDRAIRLNQQPGWLVRYAAAQDRRVMRIMAERRAETARAQARFDRNTRIGKAVIYACSLGIVLALSWAIG